MAHTDTTYFKTSGNKDAELCSQKVRKAQKRGGWEAGRMGRQIGGGSMGQGAGENQ